MDKKYYIEDIKVPILETDICVGWYTDYDELMTALDEKFDTGCFREDDEGVAFVQQLKSEKAPVQTYLVAVFPYLQKEPDLMRSYIVHEITHLTWIILETHGVKIDEDNHEMQAYLMEHLFEKISGMIHRCKPRLSN